MTSRTDNKVGDLRVEEDGSFTVVLSHFNRPNRNGEIFRPLTREQVAAFNARPNAYGCLGQPRNKSSLGMESFTGGVISGNPPDVAFTISKVSVRDVPDERGLNGMVQEVVASVKPVGPQSDFLKELLKDPNAVLHFGLCAATRTAPGEPGVLSIDRIIGWNLIDGNPYPDR